VLPAPFALCHRLRPSGSRFAQRCRCCAGRRAGTGSRRATATGSDRPIRWLVDSGIKCRATPRTSLPGTRTVLLLALAKAGLIKELRGTVRHVVGLQSAADGGDHRLAVGQGHGLCACVITGLRRRKAANGRKRHIRWVCALGLLLAVVVTAANMTDRGRVHPAGPAAGAVQPADAGLGGRRLHRTAGRHRSEGLAVVLTLVKRSDDAAGSRCCPREAGRANVRATDALPTLGPRLHTRSHTAEAMFL
jgi:hypothetical protein